MRSKRRIDAALFDAVQYLYILHKSGASQYEAIKSLSENSEYFGDAAREFSQVISERGTAYFAGKVSFISWCFC